jgi:hypothetical protein
VLLRFIGWCLDRFMSRVVKSDLGHGTSFVRCWDIGSFVMCLIHSLHVRGTSIVRSG